ncbi:MAG: hypothetical protein HF975_04385 [ANME-2 cluster archaeon]|nr:hypothetical protein [ANME-2 cluster archaeon]
MRTEPEIKTQVSQASGHELELVWIPKIMEHQTQDEEISESTIELNGKGLNAFDAGLITSLYHQVQAGNHLTPKQVSAARKVLPKYAGQYRQMMT